MTMKVIYVIGHMVFLKWRVKMLFVLGEDIKNEISQNNYTDELAHILDNLASMIRSGKHMFFLERKFIQSILTDSPIRNHSKQIYNALLNSVRQIKPTIEKLSVIAEITNEVLEVEVINSNRKIVRIPGNYIINDIFTKETALIFEDFYDIDFISRISEIIMKRKDIYSAKFNYDPINGAGGRTGEALSKRVRAMNQFCLCVADTDKKSPFCNSGDTCNKIILANNELIADDLDHYSIKILNCHEIENLIPTFITNKVYGDNNAYNTRLEQQKKIFDYEKTSRLYFDFKNGITEQIIENEISTAQLYWKPILTECGIISEGDVLPKGKIVAGLKDYLTRSINFVKDNRELLEQELIVEDIIESEWDEICIDYYSWCCCLPKLRS